MNAIIEDESELCAYMNTWGHKIEKTLRRALKAIYFDSKEDDINCPVTTVDWGCGQGVATPVLNDYLEYGVPICLEDIFLIDPSKIALKRAGLHSLKYIDRPALHTKPLFK